MVMGFVRQAGEEPAPSAWPVSTLLAEALERDPEDAG